MPEPGAAEITPKPAAGRIFRNGRRIRLGDVDPTGRCRLDATVRHLQDIARDDSADADLTDPMNWVVRRTMLEMHQAPVFQEWIDLATWCSGHGGRWAERRTEIRGDHGAYVEAVTVWIYVDGETGAPKKLLPDFFELYGESAGERTVSARQQLPSKPPETASETPWPVRFADLDVLGHVNNAAHWQSVEEVRSQLGVATSKIRAEIEFSAGVERGTATLRVEPSEGGFTSWLMTPTATGSVARITPW
ncbi:MAG: acyl-ACP thioesterase domain-containing protein [Actinomycetota bacterium]